MSEIPYVFNIFVSLDGQYVPFYLIFSGETNFDMSDQSESVAKSLCFDRVRK